MGLAGEAQPGRPFGRDDADDVGVVAEAGDAPLLDGEEPELGRLADGVAHGGLGHTDDRREVADGEAAILPPHDLRRHEGKDRLLS